MKNINKVILLPLILCMLLKTISEAYSNDSKTPPNIPAMMQNACQIPLEALYEDIKNNHMKLQSRFLDKIANMIVETYVSRNPSAFNNPASEESDYVLVIGITSLAKVCILAEGKYFQNMQGFPI